MFENNKISFKLIFQTLILISIQTGWISFIFDTNVYVRCVQSPVDFADLGPIVSIDKFEVISEKPK